MAGVEEEVAVARIASVQQGMVTARQLAAAGFGPNAVARRVTGGWLVRRHAGVYQLGVHGGPLGDETAALMACGPGSVLGHWASMAVFDVRDRAGRPVDVLVQRDFSGRLDGVRRHVTRWLAPGDVVQRHRLPVTVPARTLLDLAATASRRELERLVEDTQVRRLTSVGELQAMVERGAGRRGVRSLRAIVADLDEPMLTRSEAERLLLAAVRTAGRPLPRTNVRVAGLEVDAVWLEQRLIVEVDGFAFHGTRAAFERDRRRDARLLLAGFRVIRLTWRQLVRERSHVVVLLRTALSAETKIVPLGREGSTSRC